MGNVVINVHMKCNYDRLSIDKALWNWKSDNNKKNKVCSTVVPFRVQNGYPLSFKLACMSLLMADIQFSRSEWGSVKVSFADEYFMSRSNARCIISLLISCQVRLHPSYVDGWGRRNSKVRRPRPMYIGIAQALAIRGGRIAKTRSAIGLPV